MARMFGGPMGLAHGSKSHLPQRSVGASCFRAFYLFLTTAASPQRRYPLLLRLHRALPLPSFFSSILLSFFRATFIRPSRTRSSSFQPLPPSPTIATTTSTSATADTIGVYLRPTTVHRSRPVVRCMYAALNAHRAIVGDAPNRGKPTGGG